ncbi:dirigent protein 23-like [Coffea eugenioides]|uniref:dirigent protein 23-like n=1 Tax=Coffea eugenioides TaxID=49369 RepID=UPI000F609588|nr:dirigent protein 23-like [Coffea eugenioides]
MKTKKMTAVVAMLWWAVMLGGVAMPLARGSSIDQSPQAVEKWFEELPHAKEKLTKLHFYLHDNITAQNPTAIQVAQANITSKSPTMFGATFVLEDPLTLGPDPSSKIIGHAQGIYSSVSKEETSLILILNLVFTHGKFEGSTLSLLGIDPILHQYRELPILGGTGVFRLARGIATAQTYTFNATTLNAIVEYHVLVIHY